MKVFLITFLFSSFAFATVNDKLHLPKSFPIQGGQAVFVDMLEANYSITYDTIQKKAFVVAQIAFETIESGRPIFDSVVAPTSVKLNEQVVSAPEVSTPQNETKVRVISKVVPAGVHQLRIEIPLTHLVNFNAEGVRSSFWASDLDERSFLEAYLPANLEFDQVKMTFNISFVGPSVNQVIYTNGKVTQYTSGKYKVEYPSYYTSSSIYFHVVPKGAMKEQRFTLKSIDGREIPSVVYHGSDSTIGSLETLKRQTTQVFHELESDYGPYPHSGIIVYQAGFGGMEYCGATMTELRALGHEMFHFYFARAVMPANGNAGWIDEALASWRDANYRTRHTMTGTSGMSSHPYYTRTTDKLAYTFGRDFMGYLDGKLDAKGGLKPFMRYMMEERKFSPLFVEEFISEISKFYSVSLEADFKHFTFGKREFKLKPAHSTHHQKMSLKQLEQYL